MFDKKPLVSIMHEEDWASCKLTHLIYSSPSIPAIELQRELDPVLGRLLYGLDSQALSVRLSRLNLIYSKEGDLLLILHMPSSKDEEPKAIVTSLEAGTIPKDPSDPGFQGAISEKLQSAKIEQVLRFNDPQDLLLHPRALILDREADLSNLLKEAVTKVLKSYGTSFSGIAKASAGGGPLDFMMRSHTMIRDRLMVVQGRIYNEHDLGNYLWGAALKQLKVFYTTAKVGSEVNAFFNTRSQNHQGNGIILFGDSAKDQEAIRRGYFGLLGTGKPIRPAATTHLRLPPFNLWSVETTKAKN